MRMVDFEALFRASPYPHLVMNEQLVVLDVNDAFIDLVSVERATIIGKYVIDILVENSGYMELINYTDIKDLLEKSRENEQRFNTTFMEGERKIKPVFVIQHTEEEAGVTGELLHMNNFSKELKEQELAAQYKDEFLARIAHELRNPVSSINAAAEILSLAQPDPARLQKMTEVIKRQINLLVGLIDDLSDVSHFAKGLTGSDMRLLDIKQVVMEAIEETSTIVKARNHTLKVESLSDDLYIIGDHKRVLQVFKNVLSNAAKYTPHGGNIWVKLAAERDQVTVNVIDDGNGIAPDLLPKIFDLFGPASQATDHINHGLGIGLAVVKNIVEKHGGSVAAFSTGGIKGSRFEIRFPAAALVKSS
jgi:signal transduction histidine kinase